MSEFSKERDDAFVDFVMNDNTDKLKAYCEKYNVPMPEDEKIMACGIYKAVQYCTDISDEVKTTAAWKCLERGMSPFIDWGRGES